MMDYPYAAKFGILVSAVLFYRANKQTDRITHTGTDADECYTHATADGVSK